MIDPDPVANARRIAAGEETIQEQIKRSVRRTQRIHDEAARRQVAGDRETARLVANIWKDALDKRERLALTSGKKVGDIEKATSREVVQQQEKSTTLMMRELKRYFDFNVHERRRANDRAAGEQQRADRESTREQQRTNQQRTRTDDRTFRVLFTLFDDYLKRRRARERAAQFADLAAQKAADRRSWQEQKATDSRNLSAQKAAERQAAQEQRTADSRMLAQLREHEKRVTNAHKTMWSIVRSITETGGRFLSSITQSALRGMGNAVGYGLRGVLSRFKRGTDQQEEMLRSSYKQQEAITRGGLAQQEGAIASFQARANRGVIGTLFNLRNVLAGAGVYLGARAIFGPVMEYEQTQVAFENLLGSAEKAASLLADLRAFNVATPFELPQIQNAAKQLLAMGETMQEIVPDLTAIGDVGAKFSASDEDVNGVIRALGQMSQSAKVSAQDINQIQQRFVGFNARAAIARGLGISVAEAMEKIADGSISGNEGMNAMIEGMKSEANAAGAMEEQMKTLTGRLSNFKDLLTQIMLDVMVPLLPVMQDVVEQITSFIDQLAHGRGIWAVARSALMGIGIALGLIVAQEAAGAVLNAVGQSLKLIAANPLTAFVAAATTLGVVMYRHNDDFRAFVDDFLDRVGEFVTRFSGPVLAFFEDFQTVVGGVVTSILNGDWDGAYRQVAEFGTQIKERLRPAKDFLVNFGERAWEKWQDWLDAGGFGDLADTIWTAIDGALKDVKQRLKDYDWQKFLAPAAASLALALAIIFLDLPVSVALALVAGIGLIFTSPRVREGIQKQWDKFTKRIGEMWSDFTKDIDWFGMYKDLIDGTERVTAKLTKWLLEFVSSPEFQKTVLALTAIVVGMGAAIITGLVDGIIQAAPDVFENNLELQDEFATWILDNVPGARTYWEFWEKVYEGVWNGLGSLRLISGHGPNATKFWDNLWDDITGAITDVDWGQKWGEAVDLLATGGGLGTLAGKLWDWLHDALSGAWDTLKESISSWAENHNPGQVIGDTWHSGLASIQDSFGGFGDGVWDSMKDGINRLKDNLFWKAIGIEGLFTGIPGRVAESFGSFGAEVLKSIGDSIGGAKGFAGEIVQALKDLINTHIIEPLNDISLSVSVAGRSFTLDFPDIQPLAKGGIVTSPTLALIGEAGPEAVVPLSGTQGQIPLNIMFDVSAVAGQMAAIVALLAPLGQMILEATAPGMRAWEAGFVATLASITRSLTQWGTATTTLAAAIAAGIVAGITTGLRTGKAEVTAIVRGYGRSLVGALNPLLTGIGEPAVTLAYAKGGIAEAHAGPQVHVFNEGKRGRGSSHGEAYIPFDPSNRPRSRSLATETVRRLGGDVQWFANGGITASQVQPGTSVPGVSGDVVGLVTEFARRLSTWSLANGGGYHVGSGYRSIARQAELYRDYLAGVPGQAPAAPPGSSLHNFGLASDGNHWRDRNPAAFGLTFPMSYEPWHVQPVEGKGLLNGDSAFPMFEPLPQPPSAGRRGVLSTVAAAWMRYVYDKTLAKAGSFTAPMGSMPSLGSAGASPEILAAIQRAMQIVGVPSSWLGPLLTLISRESGFNPRAYNGVLGASGLMQTIPATFASNALPGYGGIFDPLANVIAGLRYILGRYGSIFNVGQAVAAHPTKGYSYGGVVERDGMYRLSEGNRREVVLPLENRGRLLELLRRTGLDKTIAMASGVHPDNGLLPVGSATSRTSPSLGPVVGEMNVYSNATDPETVGTIAANKVDRQVRSVLTGVGSL